MRRGLTRLIAAVAVSAIVPSAAAAADDAWGAIRVPGGVAAMRRVAGLGDGPRARTSVIIDLVRAQAGLTVRGSPETRERFVRYLEYILLVEQTLAAAPDGFGLSETMANDRREQDRLRDALAVFGLRFRGSGSALAVELDREETSLQRHRWLRAAGVDVQDMADELNTRERVRPSLRSEDVPLPAPSFFASLLRKDHEPLLELVSTPEHLLTYYGLMSLDQETIGWLAANPAVLKHLHDDRAVIFGGFAAGLTIRRGAVGVPGGASAIPVWERLVAAAADDPAQFVSNLFERDGGRLAYFYSTVAALDPVRQAFLIGPATTDRRMLGERLRYAEAILDRFTSACPTWDPQIQPLFRPAIDPAFVVSLVDVRPSGDVGPDWWPSLFEHMADSGDWPARPRDTLGHLSPQPANAYWLLSFVFDNDALITQRWQWVRFAQRQFANAPQTAAHEVEVGLRTFKDMPALALALERMGIASPGAFVDIARAARRLALATDGDDAERIVRGWQGALAVLEQIHRHRPLDSDALAALLSSFVRAMPAKPMDPSGNSTRWVLHELLPALDAAVPPADDMEADVLRKVLARAPASPPFSWEGVSFRVDMGGPVRDSALQIRAVMPGPKLQHLAELDAAAQKLEAPRALPDVALAVTSLERVYAALKSPKLLDRITALKRIRADKDAPKAARERRAILELADDLAADVLPSLAYALAVSPSGQAARTFADSARLHSLFSREATGRWQSYAWLPGDIANRDSGGTAIRGSLLGLDLARSQDLLARAQGVVERQASGAGSLHEVTQRILVDRLALRTRSAWVEDAAIVTAGLARGRAQLAALKADPALAATRTAELTRAGISQSRQNQLLWALARRASADADALLTMSELFHLGSTTTLPVGWAQAGTLIDGCWCVREPDRAPLERFRGYSVGYVAAMVSDLPLRLAEVLADMRVPADVIEPMLMFGVQDILDQAGQFVADDWDSLTWSSRLTPARVEDYLQAMVARQILASPNR